MRIAICDDDPIWRAQAQTILTDYGNRTGRTFTVSAFGGGEELLASTESIDLLFLDIEMGEQDGISVAGEVNKKWKKCSIVYLSDYISYSVDVYETKHAYYALKSQFRDRIAQIFEKILHEKAQQSNVLSFRLIDGKVLRLAAKDILYFERDKRITRIVVDAKGSEPVSYITRDKISTIEKLLPPLDFVRCHNSYIVYFPAVKEVERNAIVMKNGDVIDVSRQYQGKMRKVFLEWARMQ